MLAGLGGHKRTARSEDGGDFSAGDAAQNGKTSTTPRAGDDAKRYKTFDHRQISGDFSGESSARCFVR